MPSTTAVKLSLAAAAGLAIACAGACGPKQIEPAPKPLRPKPEPVVVATPKNVRTDCDRVTVGDEKPALLYQERSRAEAENLAKEGFDMLVAAEQRGVPTIERQRLVTKSVDRFITALLADPYNVHATYNLAAAYARIKRPQCAINLLSRLEALRRLQSQTAKVEAKLDRLLGRGRFKGDLDPDFKRLRDDQRFRQLVKRLQK